MKLLPLLLLMALSAGATPKTKLWVDGNDKLHVKPCPDYDEEICRAIWEIMMGSKDTASPVYVSLRSHGIVCTGPNVQKPHADQDGGTL